MNTNIKTLKTALSLVLLLSFGTAFAAVPTGDEKYEAIQTLHSALDRASSRYRATGGIQNLVKKNESAMQEAQEKMEKLAVEKLALRRTIISLRDTINTLEERYGIDLRNEDQVREVLESEKDSLLSFARYMYGTEFSDSFQGAVSPGVVLKRTLTASLGDRIDEELRIRALAEVRAKIFSFALNASLLPETLDDLLQKHDAILVDYQAAQSDYLAAQKGLSLSESQLAEVQRETAAVQRQILSLQGELARIDAQLREKTERVLIEKGLRTARSDNDTIRGGGAPSFIWPAHGRISAGYLDDDYKDYFGVPHRGIDIPVMQGSNVYAAEDGIVYLARDGGKTGYSYILVGHKNGYATLYGHLSAFTVSTGQMVTKGSVIGLSGGAPGTHGAGPMTTGSHLHFEAMKDGQHLNPLVILP